MVTTDITSSTGTPHSAARKPLRSLKTGLLAAIRSAFRPRLDPDTLTEAQRRDAGIDPCEIERIEILKRPLIKW